MYTYMPKRVLGKPGANRILSGAANAPILLRTIYIHIHIYMCICMYIYVYTYIYVCYIYIYMCIYIYIYANPFSKLNLVGCRKCTDLTFYNLHFLFKNPFTFRRRYAFFLRTNLFFRRHFATICLQYFVDFMYFHFLMLPNIHVCTRIYIYKYTYKHIYIHTYICICIRIYRYVCIIYLSVYVFMCIYIYMLVILIYILTYIYIRTHMYTYIYLREKIDNFVTHTLLKSLAISGFASAPSASETIMCM